MDAKYAEYMLKSQEKKLFNFNVVLDKNALNIKFFTV